MTPILPSSVVEADPRIPAAYHRGGVKVSTAASLDTTADIFGRWGIENLVPMWQVRAEHKTLAVRRPILLRHWVDGVFHFVENETLGIIGTGSSLDDAARDFGLHVQYLYHYYSRLQENEICGDAVRLKKIFAELVIPEK